MPKLLPPATRALVVANALLYFFYFLLGLPFMNRLALWPTRTPWFHLWQMLTYSFMQISILHLLVNMAVLVFLGRSLERLWGARNYLLYYFACVLAAAGIWLAWAAITAYPSSTAGASGGVFGLLLAYALVDPKAPVLEGVRYVPRWLFVFLFGALELLLGVFDAHAGVAHFAHLGGMVGGALMIAFWRTARPVPRR